MGLSNKAFNAMMCQVFGALLVVNLIKFKFIQPFLSGRYFGDEICTLPTVWKSKLWLCLIEVEMSLALKK